MTFYTGFCGVISVVAGGTLFHTAFGVLIKLALYTVLGAPGYTPITQIITLGADL